MKIISWNVNSVRTRLAHLEYVVHEYRPDVFLLQETRVDDRAFPRDLLEDLGYNVAFRGEKARNGVAILSKNYLEDVKMDFCEEARYIEAFTGGIYVASIYVPNGRAVGADHYFYKLDFLRNLEARLAQMQNEIFVVGGDFNVAPYAKDACEEINCDELLCCSPKEREAVRCLRALGYTDPLSEKGFTWWDYRFGAFKRNIGLRIDQFYLSPKANELFLGGDVLKKVRALEKPSDHAPILCEIRGK